MDLLWPSGSMFLSLISGVWKCIPFNSNRLLLAALARSSLRSPAAPLLGAVAAVLPRDGYDYAALSVVNCFIRETMQSECSARALE